LRHLSATLLAMAYATCAAGCTPAATSPTVWRSSSSPATTAPSIALPSATATSVPATSPSPAAAEPDRYPAHLAGLPFAVFESAESTVRIVGRIGLPERLHLEEGEFPLGIREDHLLSVVQGAESEIRLRSFATGTFAAQPVTWPGYIHALGLASDTEVIATVSTDRADRVTGIVAISMLDGAVRMLVEPAATPAAWQLPTRSFAVSANGKQVATSFCKSGIESEYGCLTTSVIDIASGTLNYRVDTDGLPVERFSGDWLLTGDVGHIRVIDREGHELWSSADLGDGITISARMVLDGRIVAEVAGLAGDSRSRLVLITIVTGKVEVIYDSGNDVQWSLWPALSTSHLLAIGDRESSPCGLFDGCGRQELRPIDLAVLDLDTGILDPSAIHLTIVP
jgi:hypothetical protein